VNSYTSHIILTENAEVLRNSAIHFLDNEIRISEIFNNTHETENTLFCDGIISPPIISLSLRKITNSNFPACNYKILNINELNTPIISVQNKIIDFGTEIIPEINSLLLQKIHFLKAISSIDFILSCTSISLSVLKLRTDIITIPNYVNWRATDLINKNLTDESAVVELH
jgi:hypothetical protein